ncbi:MAG: sugar phosphate isomerase/epimerase family protein, partial [Promethearchaeota archaeon]
VELRDVWRKRIHKLPQSSLEEVKELLEKYGFKVSALGSPLFNHKFPLSDSEKETMLNLLKKYVDLAEYFETDNIRVFSFQRWPLGSINGERETREQNKGAYKKKKQDLLNLPKVNYDDDNSDFMKELNMVAAFLIDAAKISAAKGKRLALENEPKLFGAGVKGALTLIKKIYTLIERQDLNNKNNSNEELNANRVKQSIGLLLDPGNMYRHNNDVPAEKFKEIYPYVIYTHVKDVGKNIFGLRKHVPICDKHGLIPYVDIFTDMREFGYDSYFSVETHMAGNKWKNSVKCLNGLIQCLKMAGWDTSPYGN